MNTTRNSLRIKTIYFTGLLIGSFIPGVCPANDTIAELALLDAADQWQMNRLFEPTSNQRLKEAEQGVVMIYDGLRDTTVSKALDENFDRIQNMMFTRVVVTDPAGKPRVDETGNRVTEDDGC